MENENQDKDNNKLTAIITNCLYYVACIGSGVTECGANCPYFKQKYGVKDGNTGK